MAHVAGLLFRRDSPICTMPKLTKNSNATNRQRAELDFGADASIIQRTFKIKNTGTQNVSFNVTNTANWIVSTNPSSGELNAGSTTSILVVINREMLAVGNNTSSLLINTPSNGGKELVVRAVRTPSLYT